MANINPPDHHNHNHNHHNSNSNSSSSNGNGNNPQDRLADHNSYNTRNTHNTKQVCGTGGSDSFSAMASAYSGISGGGGGRDDGNITAPQKMLAACSGSLLASLLVTPLDVVRVRLQSQHPTPLPHSKPPSTLLRVSKLPLSPLTFNPSTAGLSTPELGVTACCREVFWITNTPETCFAPTTPTTFTDSCVAEETTRRRFNGTWEGLVKIAKYEGVTSLWRGLSPTLLMAIPANVIYFTGYDFLRASTWSPFSDLGTTWAPLLAGSSARAIAASVISPVELFRTRLQAAGADHTFSSTLSGVRTMVAAEGVASLWRGLSLTLWRDVPFSGVYWFGYELIREELRRGREQNWHLTSAPLHPRGGESVVPKDLHSESTFVDAFVAGAASGSVAALLTTPFDVGKTRRQVSTEAGRLSMPRLLWNIWTTEGMGGLMRGCVPRMLKVAPACAIMISSYEVGKKAAARMNSSSD